MTRKLFKKGNKTMSMQKITPQDRLYVFIGSACGLGLSPIMPGTMGALSGVMLHVLIVLLLPAWLITPALIAALLLVSLLNHVLTPWAEKFWQEKDPSHFVLDEVAGYLIIPILFPLGALWKTALWGFILFRLFDITKICPPAKYVDQQMPGSWGILLDDIIAGIYAAGVIYLLYVFFPAVIV